MYDRNQEVNVFTKMPQTLCLQWQVLFSLQSSWDVLIHSCCPFIRVATKIVFSNKREIGEVKWTKPVSYFKNVSK